MAINESGLENYPIPLFFEEAEILLKQMKGCVCKINSERATGFFCKIPIDNKEIPVFVTNNHVISEKYLSEKNEIKIMTYKDQSPKIIRLKNKIFFTSKEYDVTIIEMDENKDEDYEYLQLDENILDEDGIDNYKGKSIYIIQYPSYHETQKLAVSFGILKNRSVNKKYDFTHFCCTEHGSSGSPILNIINNKVIGIHKQGGVKNYNIGCFLYYSIKEFINIYNNEHSKLLNLNENDANINELSNKGKNNINLLNEKLLEENKGDNNDEHETQNGKNNPLKNDKITKKEIINSKNEIISSDNSEDEEDEKTDNSTIDLLNQQQNIHYPKGIKISDANGYMSSLLQCLFNLE